jgi:hypothetical protein
MKTCSSCGRSVADEDGFELKDGRFYCKSGGCQKKFLDGIVENEVISDITHSGGRVIKLVDTEKPVQNSTIPVSKDVSTKSNQECELCHKDQVEGNLYRFYYGKKTGTSFIDTLLALRGISSPPLIKDHGSVWICRRCTNFHVTQRRMLLASVLLVAVLLLAAWFLQPPVSLLLPPLGLILVGISILFLIRLGGEKEIPERLAIRIRKKELRQQGYNVFLTKKQFAKLR